MIKSAFEDVVSISGSARRQWPNRYQFLCANIAFAIGLGNVWRFPYLAQANGGGTFLVPYFICLLLIGLPLFTLEISIGQRLRKGAMGAYSLFHKRFLGIGVAMVVYSLFVSYYYNMVVGWGFYYFVNSMQDPLPWKDCVIVNRTLTAVEDPYGSFSGMIMPAPISECQKAGSTLYFWYRETLDISNDLYPIGEGVKYSGVTVPMIVVLTLCWFCVFLLLRNGAEATGNVLYFIAIFPYVVFTIFLIIGTTTPGGLEGLLQLFSADWSELSNPTLWVRACGQIFYTCGVCFGCIIAFSSCSPAEQDFISDTIIILGINCFTSLLASCVIFSLLGTRAWKNNEECISTFTDAALNRYDLPENTFNDYSELYDTLQAQYPSDFAENSVVELFGSKRCDFTERLLSEAPSGSGLIFNVVADAVTHLPGSYILSTMFFFMVILLGVGSMLGNLTGVITPLHDFSTEKRWNISKTQITGGVSLLLLAGGIVLASPSGIYWLDLIDNNLGGVAIILVGLAQLLVVGWAFGAKKWMFEIEWLIGPPKTIFGSIYRSYLCFCWAYLSPVLIVGLIIYYIIEIIEFPPTYKRWSAEIGDWMKNPEPISQDDLTSFYYDPLGTSIIALLHVVVLFPLIFYFILPSLPRCANNNQTEIKK